MSPSKPPRGNPVIEDQPPEDQAPRRVRWLPGDRTHDRAQDQRGRQRAPSVAAMIRVDHAGEMGATRIYAGQLAVLGGRPEAAPIREMAAQEATHLEVFEILMRERHVRPTFLSPLWHVAGFALGAASACLGVRGAMACTEAVEDVIDDHYRRQAQALGPEEDDIKTRIEEFRAEERAHGAVARAHGAGKAPFHGPLTAVIKAATRAAITLSTRL